MKVAKLRKFAADRQCPLCRRKTALQVGVVTDFVTRLKRDVAVCDWCGGESAVPDALKHLLAAYRGTEQPKEPTA